MGSVAAMQLFSETTILKLASWRTWLMLIKNEAAKAYPAILLVRLFGWRWRDCDSYCRRGKLDCLRPLMINFETSIMYKSTKRTEGSYEMDSGLTNHWLSSYSHSRVTDASLTLLKDKMVSHRKIFSRHTPYHLMLTPGSQLTAPSGSKPETICRARG